MYYSLKAAKIPALNTSDIANITDQSRFIPAGMDTVNKAVCVRILQEMDAEESLSSNTALCAWDYVCDYKADRYPNYLFKARCKTARCNGNCSRVNNRHNMCQSRGIHVTILQMTRTCGQWAWGQELLPITCSCTNYVTMKAESICQDNTASVHVHADIAE